MAINRATGDGLVSVQGHSGAVIYYRRFEAGGVWVDPAPVHVPHAFHAWYDGHTFGMNDQGEFVLLWRADNETLDMSFFEADGTLTTTLSIPTIDFEASGAHLHDSFRLRHQHIATRGDNFLLGEVYNPYTPPANRLTRHFEYSPEGTLIRENSTLINREAGLSLRMDGQGNTYTRSSRAIYRMGVYP